MLVMARYVIFVLGIDAALCHVAWCGCMEDLQKYPRFTDCLKGYSTFVQQAAQAGGNNETMLCSAEGQAAIGCIIEYGSRCPDVLLGQGIDQEQMKAICSTAGGFGGFTTPKPEPTCGLSKVDAVFILDASTSVMHFNFRKMLKFCMDIVDKVDIDSGSVRIGVVIYSSDVEIQFNLNQYRTANEVKVAINNIPYLYGSTNSADALKTMHSTMFTAANGDRPDVDNIAFMVTDGVSNINSRRTIPEAQAAMNKGIRIYAIGIGLTDTRELNGMGSDPKSDNVFIVKHFDDLNDVIQKIFGEAASSACAPDLPPVANAGSDVERQFPVALITLDGRASTDDKAVVKYKWTLQEGARVRTWDTQTVNLDNQPVGVYTFTLTVEDEKGQRDDDTVKVTVLGKTCMDAQNCVALSMNITMDVVELAKPKTKFGYVPELMKHICGTFSEIFRCITPQVETECTMVVDGVRNISALVQMGLPPGIMFPKYETLRMLANESCPKLQTDFGTSRCTHDNLQTQMFEDCITRVNTTYTTPVKKVSCEAVDARLACLFDTLVAQCGKGHYDGVVKNAIYFFTDESLTCDRDEPLSSDRHVTVPSNRSSAALAHISLMTSFFALLSLMIMS